MSKWKRLSRFQQALLVALAAMLVIFTAVYPLLANRRGFAYQDTLLLRSTQGENTRYTGKVDGRRAEFTVAPTGTITYQYGDTLYGPYTVTEDPSAVPENHEMADLLAGVEVREGESVLFRGGWHDSEFPLLVDESGSDQTPSYFAHSTGGKAYGPDGQEIIPSPAPTVTTLIQLAMDPPLTHRGMPYAYLAGTLLAIMGIVSILFAEQFFRWHLSFRIRAPEQAEPSDWELFTRYLGWIICPVLALLLYLMGIFTIV